MKRDLKKLSSERYDVIVVGAGIYGAAVAWDAALRGLKTAVIDRGDFGGATSANSLKTIHGGLRYLQQLDFARMRESIRERMILMHIAPHLVHPLPVLMPTYSYKLKSRPALFAAMLVNDIIGFDRNRLPDPQKRIPAGRTVSARKLREMIPGYDKYNLNGGALWFDCQCTNTERLLLAYIISAVERGADAANYVEATGLIREGGRVDGVQVRDLRSGERFAIRGQLVFNECGPWVDRILADITGAAPKQRFLHSTALNLVINRPLAAPYALGLSGPFRHRFADGSTHEGFRILFFSPWRGRTIIGTDHRPYQGDTDWFKPSEAAIGGFLADINRAYPAAAIRREEVSFFNGGFLPMTGLHPRTGEVQLLRHYRIHDHAAEDGVDGLISVIGVKYTTARDVAARTLDFAGKKTGKTLPASKTDTERLCGGDIDRFEDFIDRWSKEPPAGLNARVMRHLAVQYGSALPAVTRYGETGREWLEVLPGSDEVIRAQVLHAVREEMAQTLADVVLRRTDLGSAGDPGDPALRETAAIMARELQWPESRIGEEIDLVRVLYEPA